MEYEIRLYHFGDVTRRISNLTKQQARIEYFWHTENENQYTELVVNGVPKETYEAEGILGFEGKREFHFGKAHMAQRAKAAARVRAAETQGGTYYERHKEELREKHKRYREENKEKVRGFAKSYRERNREKVNEWSRAYRARKKAERMQKDEETDGG